MRMNDGSRYFGDFPEVWPPEKVRDHALRLPGAVLTGFVSDGFSAAWIHFRYRGHEFSLNNQLNDFLVFVQDPSASEDLLREVLNHFRPWADREA